MRKFRGIYKNIILIALSAIILFSVISVLNFANLKKEQKDTNPIESVSAWSGNGTASSPYLITSISDMNILSDNIAGKRIDAEGNVYCEDGNPYYNTYFKLTTDLDYSDVSNFAPIGTVLDGTTIIGMGFFGGIFDGDGHVISNLKTTVNDRSNDYIPKSKGETPIGFFAGLGLEQVVSPNSYNYSKYNRTAEVKNLKIRGFSIQSSADLACIGGIAGVARTYGIRSRNIYDQSQYNDIFFPVNIDQCIVEGLSVGHNGTFGYISGLVGAQRVGFNQNDGITFARPLTITNCMVLGCSLDSMGENSLISVIGPAYSVCNDAISTHTFYEGKNRFKFYYDIEDCMTDNMTNYTALGNSSDIYNIYGSCNVPEYMSDVLNDYHEDVYIYDSDWEKIESVYFELSRFWHSDFSSSVWAFLGDDSYAYLSQFLVQVSYESSNEEMGTVEAFAGDYYTSETTLWALRGELPSEGKYNSNSLEFCGFKGENLYRLEATAIGENRFSGWTIADGNQYGRATKEIIANFRKTGFTIKFGSVEGAEIDVETKEYSVSESSQLEISFEGFSKIGAFKQCMFTFTPQGETNEITVTYTLDDGKKFISGASDGVDLIIDGTIITITADMEFSVVLQTKSYSIDFS